MSRMRDLHDAAAVCAFNASACREHEATRNHEGDPIAELVDVVHVVRGQYDGLAGIAKVGDDALDDAGVDRIEAGGWLVEEQDLGIVLDCPHEIETHAHTLGEGLHLVVRGILQSDQCQQFQRVAAPAPVERCEEPEVLDRGELDVVVR